MSFVIKRHGAQPQLIAKSAARRREFSAESVIAAAACSSPIANDLVPALTVKRVPLTTVKVAKQRVRKASKEHVAAVAKSISTVGQVAPIIVDGSLRIVDGHVVIDALRSLGATEVNIVCLDHLNDDQIKLVRISLNKLAEGSTWELGELKAQLDELEVSGYDLTVTGFTLPQLDIIQQDELEAASKREDQSAIEASANPVSRLGDLWHLGEHRLLCADALDGRSYRRVLGMFRAAAVFTDLPFNIPIKGFVSSQHADFKMAAGEMSNEEFQEFVDTAHRLIAEHADDRSVVFSCIDWRSVDRIMLGASRAGLTHINTAVWNKGSGGIGGLYRSAHELIPVLCKGKSPKTNNVELGRHGRDRTNVWSYPGANRPGSSAGKVLKHHPTPKPVEMVEDALLDVTSRGDLVLDPFLGSGTTLLAAERCGRIAVGIELDPGYVDVCIRRWEDLTGCQAVHEETQKTFAEVAAERGEVSEQSEGGDE